MSLILDLSLFSEKFLQLTKMSSYIPLPVMIRKGKIVLTLQK